MNMDMSLDFTLRTQLRMTPQMQQAILFLQMPIAELLEKIQEMADQNPLIDAEIPEMGLQSSHESQNENELQDELLPYDSEPNYAADLKTVTISLSDEQHSFENLLEHYTVDVSLREHLLWQLQFEHLNEIEEEIAIAIIDGLDENGFLNTSLADLKASLKSAQNISLEKIEKILQVIQNFDPAGIAARNMQECLLLQLKDYPENYPFLQEAKQLITEHLELLAKHDYRNLREKLKISDDVLLKLIHFIKTLNPVPGQLITTEKSLYEVPDVLVRKIQDQWIVFLNNDILPKVRIHQHYIELLRHNTDKNADYLKKNLQEAHWLIKSLDKRHKTLLAVSQYIIDQQTDFLLQGPAALKPLVIREVSQALNIHESTVSRITNHKFILTPQGLFELKYFFSSHVQGQSGDNNISSVAVKALIKQMIHQENPQKPLSDSQIALKLKQNNIAIARRTVAKYREALHIPPADQRKFLV